MPTRTTAATKARRRAIERIVAVRGAWGQLESDDGDLGQAFRERGHLAEFRGWQIHRALVRLTLSAAA